MEPSTYCLEGASLITGERDIDTGLLCRRQKQFPSRVVETETGYRPAIAHFPLEWGDLPLIEEAPCQHLPSESLKSEGRPGGSEGGGHPASEAWAPGSPRSPSRGPCCVPFPKDGISEVPRDTFDSLRCLNSHMNHCRQGLQPTPHPITPVVMGSTHALCHSTQHQPLNLRQEMMTSLTTGTFPHTGSHHASPAPRAAPSLGAAAFAGQSVTRHYCPQSPVRPKSP